MTNLVQKMTNFYLWRPLDDEPVPQRPLFLVVLGLGRLDGVGEGDEGQRQVGETVLVQRHL